MDTPEGLDGITAAFGAPAGPFSSAGIVRLPAPLKLGWEDKTISKFRCHVKVTDAFQAVFDEIHAEGLWPKLRTFDGCFNDRPIKAGGKKSTHAWGISVDLNAATNRQGKPGDMDPKIVLIFEKHGFLWGGHFSGVHRDDMHFQFAARY